VADVDLALQILLSLIALICLLGGMNLLIKGALSFLPDPIPPQPVIDNLFRFLSGIYFGLGFLMTWVVFHFRAINGLLYCIGIVVIFSELGRLYSKTQLGSAGKHFDSIMMVEIILGVSIIVLQYLR